MKMKFWFMVGLMLFTMLALSGVVLAGGGDRPPRRKFERPDHG